MTQEGNMSRYLAELELETKFSDPKTLCSLCYNVSQKEKSQKQIKWDLSVKEQRG